MSNKGQCLCGAVKFTAILKSADIGACHCGICRKNNAGPFFGLDCSGGLSFESKADLGVYKSSDWANRLFCTKCGTSIAWQLNDESMTIISSEVLDGVDDLKLDHEIFFDKKPNYYSFAEETQKITEADVMKSFAEGQAQ